jgi:hypothetical protein
MKHIEITVTMDVEEDEVDDLRRSTVSGINLAVAMWRLPRSLRNDVTIPAVIINTEVTDVDG